MGKFDSLFDEFDAELRPRHPLQRRADYYMPAAEAVPGSEPETGPTWGDYGSSLMQGGAGVVSGGGWMMKAMGFEDAGQWVQDLGNRATEYWAESLSPQAKQELQKEFIKESPDGSLEWGDAGWNTVKLMAAQSGLGTAAGMGLGGLLTKGFQLIPKLGPKVAGMLGYGLGEATISSGSAGATVEAEVDRLTHEQLSQHPEYQATLELAGGDKAKAKDLIKRGAAGDAAVLNGIGAFLLSAPFGALMGKFTAGLALATTRARSVATGAGGEAGQEFLQSGWEQFAQNKAIQENADPTRPLSKGVLNQAIGGAASGALMGAPMGLVSPLEQPVTDPGANPPNATPVATAGAGAVPPTPPPGPPPVMRPSTRQPDFTTPRPGLLGVMQQHRYKGPLQILAEKRKQAAEAGADPLEQARAGSAGLAEAMASFRGPVIPNPFASDRGGILGFDPVQQRVADAVMQRETAPKEGELLPPEPMPEKGGLPATRIDPESIIMGEVERPALTNQNIVYGEGPTVAGLLPSRIMTGLTGQPLVSGRSDGTSQPVTSEDPAAKLKAEVERIKKDMPSREKRKGKQTQVWTPDGDKLDLQFEVVESGRLLRSNDDDGVVNPAYPQELQPRDRTSLQSRVQVSDIAGKLVPNWLGASGKVSDGAPIVESDTLAVIAGNGRSAAIDRHFRMGDKAGYKQWLMDNAAEFGLDQAEIAKMQRPVLVRNLLTPLTPEQKIAMAGKSNDRDNLAMSPTETAIQDAKNIGETELAEIVDGDLTKLANLPFIRRMAGKFGINEAAGLMDTKGRANSKMIDRLTAAIVAKAYGHKGLTEAVAEGANTERKNLINALVERAGQFVKLHRTGRYADIGQHIGDAIDMLRDADSRGLTLDEYLAQSDVFADRSEAAQTLALFFDDNKRSQKAIVEGLGQVYADLETADSRQESGQDMFGEVPPTTEDVIKRRLKDEIERARGGKGNSRADPGLDSQSQPGKRQASDGQNGGNQASQGSPQAESAAEQDFALDVYSEEDIAQKEREQRAAIEAEAARKKAEEDRIKADEAVDGFVLAGSDAPADVAMAHGQDDMFVSTPASKKAETAQAADPAPKAEPAQADQPATKKKGIPLTAITIKQSSTIEETGETVEIEAKADVLLRRIDKRLATYQSLLECVRT